MPITRLLQIIAGKFGVTANSSLEEFERAVIGHPFFELESE